MLTKTQVEELRRFAIEETPAPEWFLSLEEDDQRRVISDVFLLALSALEVRA